MTYDLYVLAVMHQVATEGAEWLDGKRYRIDPIIDQRHALGEFLYTIKVHQMELKCDETYRRLREQAR